MQKPNTIIIYLVTFLAMFSLCLSNAHADSDKGSVREIVMKPGESKSMVLKENEQVRFNFTIPETGKCFFTIQSESTEEMRLNMGMMDAIIKKDQPMVLVEIRDAKNPEPNVEFKNVTGRTTEPITFTLSELKQ